MIGKDASSISQCYENIMAGLNHYGLEVGAVLTKQTDRVLFQAHNDWHKILNASAMFSSWNFNSLHGMTARCGWRENVAWCSMQIVEHYNDGFLIFEVDYDICNPNFGVAPAVGHLVEVFWPGKTDPYRICKGLLKRGFQLT